MSRFQGRPSHTQPGTARTARKVGYYLSEESRLALETAKFRLLTEHGRTASKSAILDAVLSDVDRIIRVFLDSRP